MDFCGCRNKFSMVPHAGQTKREIDVVSHLSKLTNLQVLISCLCIQLKRYKKVSSLLAQGQAVFHGTSAVVLYA